VRVWDDVDDKALDSVCSGTIRIRVIHQDSNEKALTNEPNELGFVFDGKKTTAGVYHCFDWCARTRTSWYPLRRYNEARRWWVPWSQMQLTTPPSRRWRPSGWMVHGTAQRLSVDVGQLRRNVGERFLRAVRSIRPGDAERHLETYRNNHEGASNAEVT